MLGVRDTTPSWCVMHECGLEPLLHFNWFRAAMRLYNSLTISNSVGMLDNVTSLAYQAYYRLTNYTLTGNHRKVSV